MRKFFRAIRDLMTARKRRIADEDYMIMHWDNGE